MGCLKIMLMVINVLFFLAGAGIMAAGLFVRFEKTFIKTFLEEVGVKALKEELYTGAYVLIAFGAFTFVAGFLGCCGAMKKSKCMMGIYIALVVAVLAAEIGGGVFVYNNKDDIVSSLETEATKFIKEKYDNSSASSVALNQLMQELKCCGVNSTMDFIGSPFNIRQSEVVPIYCCKRENNQLVNETGCLLEAAKNLPTRRYLIPDGCSDKLEGFLESNAIILLGVGLGIALFEILVTIMAVVYCCNIDKDD